MHKMVKGNPDLCMGCRTCMAACVVAHNHNGIFELDADSYTFNPRLNMTKTATITIPIQCKHCENPACKASCPKNCFTIENSVVKLDTTNCIGCKQCMSACPFGAIEMVALKDENQVRGGRKIVANKCDLCYGDPEGPACVRVCPTKALVLVDEEMINKSLTKLRENTACKLMAQATDRKRLEK